MSQKSKMLMKKINSLLSKENNRSRQIIKKQQQQSSIVSSIDLDENSTTIADLIVDNTKLIMMKTNKFMKLKTITKTTTIKQQQQQQQQKQKSLKKSIKKNKSIKIIKSLINDNNNNNNNNNDDDDKMKIKMKKISIKKLSTTIMIKSKKPAIMISKNKISSLSMVNKKDDQMNEQQPLKQQQYVMDEKQIIELFKSFLRNISCQQQQQLLQQQQPKSIIKNQYVNDKDELEELNAELIDLFNQYNIVQSSYQEIVQSLISIQKNNRRHKFSTNSNNLNNNENDNRLITKIDSTPATTNEKDEDLKKQQQLQKSSKFNIMNKIMNKLEILELFMNIKTRQESFNQLFQNIEQLRGETEQFRQLFTIDGLLKGDQLNDNSNNRITIKQYKKWHEQIQQLSLIIELILQEYNREVLELFRLSQTISSSTE